jgi:parallel beta-helix repeat protein
MNRVALHARAVESILLAGLWFSALPAHAAAVSVDCDAGGSINAALANVKPGDSVLVTGTCREQVSFNAELVRVTLDGQKKTTIQHPGKGAASPHTVFIKGNDIFIKGITVIGGLDGIHLAGPASAEVDGAVVMKTNRAGIHADKGSIIRILNTTVEDSGAMGIDITGTSLAYIGVRIPRIPALSPVTVRNSGGAGITIERTSTAWIVGNTITGNKGPGIEVHRNAHADVMGNTIDANGGDAIAVSFGSGVNLRSAPRKDGPNQTTQENGGVGIRCSTGGFVHGPLGTLAGKAGAKAIEHGCVDRVEQ